ncbi:GIY-YIG nuclease family protein [Fictibacillus sp. UD]|uniref:GIY-YIG nuclease family protein n=1 Tax=Fictibacillus sp. UD TaxID=3038777 RepID=UPI00374663D1
MNVFGVKLPFKNELIYLIKTGNHHQTEVAFHKHFSHKRLVGEWFQLNQDEATV